MNEQALKQQFSDTYKAIGSDSFYKFLISRSIEVLKEDSKKKVHLELLQYYDHFLVFYRRESEIIYLEMCKIFRKAAHFIYRYMLNNKILQHKNNKFLQLVAT